MVAKFYDIESGRDLVRLCGKGSARLGRSVHIVNETRWQTIVLEHTDAQAEHDRAKAGRDAADADLRGWALADLIERKTAAEH